MYYIVSFTLFLIGLILRVFLYARKEGLNRQKELPEQMAKVRELLVSPKYKNKGSNVKVGVIDEPVHPHPKLGKVTHFRPYVITNDHGVHVSGIINNIVPESEIYSYDGINGTETGEAIEWMVKNGVKVINMSLGISGKYGDTNYIKQYKHNIGGVMMTWDELYDYLHENGVIITIAAANDNSIFHGEELVNTLTENTDDINYNYDEGEVPESTMNTWPVVVTSCKLPQSITKEDNKITAGFSPFNSLNKSVDVMSYGHDIWSTDKFDGYIKFSGTSMSSPQVAGCMALVYDYVLSQPESKNATNKEIGEYVKSFVLNECTIRDINNMVHLLPTINGMVTLNSKIDDEGNFIGEKEELAEEVRGFLSSSTIIDHNSQFSDEEWEKMSDIELIKHYSSVKEQIIAKYTTLSLGYGIIKLMKLPSFGTKVITKTPFAYIE